MNTRVKKSSENESLAMANNIAGNAGMVQGAFQLQDKPTASADQKKRQELIGQSDKTKQLQAYHEMANNSVRTKAISQLQAMADSHTAKQKTTIQEKSDSIRNADNRISANVQANNLIVQRKGTDSGIPEILIEFLGSVEAYHRIKQKHWGWILEAHTEAHSSPPGTSGAAYTIDTATATILIRILQRNGYVAGTGRSATTSGFVLSRAALARRKQKEESSSASAAAASATEQRRVPDSDDDDGYDEGMVANSSGSTAVTDDDVHDDDAGNNTTTQEAGSGAAAAAAAVATVPVVSGTTTSSSSGAGIREYKSHNDAREKLAKNKSLGTKYKIKGGDGTVFDIGDNVQDMTGKKRK